MDETHAKELGCCSELANKVALERVFVEPGPSLPSPPATASALAPATANMVHPRPPQLSKAA